MQTVVDVLKMSARPTSVTFLIVVLAVGVALAFARRTAPHARWYFLSVFAGFWIFSAPACVERLVTWSGSGFGPLVRAADAHGATTIVVLGGGNYTFRVGDLSLTEPSRTTAFRIIEGARLYRLLDHPTLILSGGTTERIPGAKPESEAMRDAIVRLGVPADHVMLESESTTTRESALVVKRMLESRAGEPIVIVTEPTHMSRSIAVFKAVGLNPVPSVAAFKSDESSDRYRWLPNDGGLILFDSVLYNAAAKYYYMARGWIPK
jgi:uncharacterized SAM-binding protein YcdF (DUF218 family)